MTLLLIGLVSYWRVKSRRWETGPLNFALCQRRPVLFDRQAGISERGVPTRRTEHNLETGCSAVGHQIRLAGGGAAERGFNIEQARFRGCRQRLCDIGQRLPVSLRERGLVSSRLVSGFAASTSVTTVVMVLISPVRSASSTA